MTYLAARATTQRFRRTCWFAFAVVATLTWVTGGSVVTAPTKISAAEAVVTPETSIAVRSTSVDFATGIGVYESASSRFRLRIQGSGTTSVWAVQYGIPGDRPLMGDWNADGIDTVGVKRGNTYYVRNSNTAGPADIRFSYGRGTDIPVVGDWNGDGIDTVAIRRDSLWYVRNSLSTGPSDYRFSFGRTDDTPIAGDWNADRIATAGVYHTGTNNWYLMTGPDVVTNFAYGKPGDTPLAGDWNGDHHATAGVCRGSNWYLKNSLSGGNADITVNFGAPTDIPLVGHWYPLIVTPT